MAGGPGSENQNASNAGEGNPAAAPLLRARPLTRLWIIGIALWFTATAGTIGWLAAYSVKPGAAEPAPATWPVDSSIHRIDHKPMLVMFAHPKCPCTLASIDELAVVLTKTHATDARVVLVVPDRLPAQWAEGDLKQAAEAVPGVTVTLDPGGREARRFGAATSGATLLYDAAGRLLFNGGITSARGHRGDNDGVDAVVALANNEPTTRHTHPVFGCGLFAAVCDKCAAPTPETPDKSTGGKK